MRARAFILGASLLAMTGASVLEPVAARAGQPDAERGSGQVEARRRYKVAEEHFRAGRYQEALREYEAGYQASPLAGFLVNIAQCYRRLGDLRKARAHYQKFVVVAPDSPLRAEVEAIIAEIDRLLADLDDSGRPPPPPPPPMLSAIPPAVPLPAELALATPAPEPSPVVKEKSRSRLWLWSAVGAVLVGGTVTAFVLSRSSPSDPIREGSIGSLRR